MKSPFGKLFVSATFAVAILLPMTAQACFSLTGACGYTKTKYPIVLVHGLLGFDQVGLYPYWYGVQESLQSYDGATVFVAQVSAANAHEVRGEQLLAYVKQVLAATGAAKVNLIGHSQGSPTARYVAAVRPDLVASVTGVDGANKGIEPVDVILGFSPPGSLSADVIASITNGYGQLVSLMTNGGPLPQNQAAAMYDLSTPGATAFNAKYPQGVPVTACGEGAYVVNGVRYFSWSGSAVLTNALDASDAILALTGLAFKGAKNDGAVGSCESHLGQVIRDDYTMNHLDAINQVAGVVSLFEVNPLTLYRQHANRLKGLGL